MSDIAIRVENLSKRYRIGRARERHDSLRDALGGGARAPLQRLRGDGRGPDETEDAIWALKDVSFEVQPGEVVGIVGRNGAGKSTLLKILSRITEPTEGKAEIHGRVGSLLEVGTGFHPELTGRENIYLNGAILGMKRAEIARKFDEIVAFSEIDKFLDTPVKRYSSGMYVRLAFAVAAHVEPEILLVDEVLAVGDAEFQQKCLDKMGDVAIGGRTVVFVSHNLAAVQEICRRAVWLDNGRLVVDAATADTLASYLKEMQAQAKRHLGERVDRIGRGRVRVTDALVLNCEEPASAVLVTGCPAEFVFRVSGAVPSMSCAFTVYDRFGAAIVAFDSGILQTRTPAAPSEVTIACSVDELLLVPGSYRMNVALRSGGRLEDHVAGAAVFQVDEGCFQGRTITKAALGRVVLRHSWCRPGEPAGR